MPNDSTNCLVQSLWIGDKLSNMEKLCLQSFVQNGHDFHLYIYQDIKNVPNEVTIKDGNEIIPFDKMFKDSSGGFSGFSNWFRYKLLYELGGWWVDMDAVCMKFFDIDEEYCFSSERDCEQNTVINCGFIKTPPRADFLLEILDYIDSKDLSNIQWGELGPRLFSAVIQTYDSSGYIKPPNSFCPVNWFDTLKLTLNHKFPFCERSFAIHLWNEMWRRENLDKDAIYHPDSMYELLKTRYNIL